MVEESKKLLHILIIFQVLAFKVGTYKCIRNFPFAQSARMSFDQFVSANMQPMLEKNKNKVKFCSVGKIYKNTSTNNSANAIPTVVISMDKSFSKKARSIFEEMSRA